MSKCVHVFDRSAMCSDYKTRFIVYSYKHIKGKFQYLLSTEECENICTYETGDKQNDQFQIFVKATETIPIIHISRK